MTGSSSHIRKPYDTTPYSSLRADAGPTETSSSAGNGRSKETAAAEFAAEGEKLKALREALWAAFEAGPEAGLPNTLIDLTMAYTGALRLQLSLRAVSIRKLSPKHEAAIKPSVKVS